MPLSLPRRYYSGTKINDSTHTSTPEAAAADLKLLNDGKLAENGFVSFLSESSPLLHVVSCFRLDSVPYHQQPRKGQQVCFCLFLCGVYVPHGARVAALVRETR